ncbi:MULTISPECIES: hypothetical protein [Saccharopolyspora]|uniref:Uncharacterized protein n=1 Tax=Saccharopolyspora cebuensis TaxID=418759 RepID=A0ABV4CPC1_9PSEU
MQNNSRTIVSVVGSMMMVLATVVFAAWGPPQEHPTPAASVSTIEHVQR